MWNVAVNSIPLTDEEWAEWPGADELCPRCGRPFGIWKQIRLPGGQIVISGAWWTASITKFSR